MASHPSFENNSEIDNSRIKLRGHESFALRQGWLRKAVVETKGNPKAFSGSQLETGVRFGVGSNMVKSIRYWAEVSGLLSLSLSHIFSI